MARRAQIEFGETLMVVIILVFLLVIGIVFYYNVSKKSLTSEAMYREDIESIKLAKAAAALPEIRCSDLAGSTTCTDKLKLEALAALLQGTSRDAASRAYYEKLFGYATIAVEFPTLASPPSTRLILYEDKPVQASGQPKPMEARQTLFTTVYNPLDDTRTIAYFDITRYVPVVG